MKRPIFILFILYSVVITVNGFSQNEEVFLWPGEIPNSIQNRSYHQIDSLDDKGILRIKQVTKPSLTIFYPNNPNGNAVVVCPGGGYKHLSIVKEGYEIAKWLNSIGITAFVLKYRLPSDSIMREKSIGPLQDAQEAIRIVRRNATKWNLDKKKIGIIGFSAGGHLASTVSTHYKDSVYNVFDSISAKPDFSILVYPVISMDEEICHKGSKINLLGERPSTEISDRFSNEKQVDSLSPPTFLVHATDDRAVPVENSIVYYLALKKYQVPTELHLFQSGGHGFGLGEEGPTHYWRKSCENWLRFNQWID